ncbi:MAG: hypothetical protein WKF84_00775 [Pyrinomonadaceae bacterium]
MSDIRDDAAAEGMLLHRHFASDLDEILALLMTVNLPCEGVTEHFDGFLVARQVGELAHQTEKVTCNETRAYSLHRQLRPQPDG